MKTFEFSRTFQKSYKTRVETSKKLDVQFQERLALFKAGERNYPLDDHVLKGRMRGSRAFSVANDLRVIYRETSDRIIFLDVGSHNQVYK